MGTKQIAVVIHANTPSEVGRCDRTNRDGRLELWDDVTLPASPVSRTMVRNANFIIIITFGPYRLVGESSITSSKPFAPLQLLPGDHCSGPFSEKPAQRHFEFASLGSAIVQLC
jgi:hypothetical protein